jgi:DNA polymerase-4
MRRVIFLVDMNAFFISCEMARNPALKGRPAAVAGDPENRSGIILAANYDARKYKVKTTMVLHEAKKLCPGLILVPPDHELYSRKSREVMAILNGYSPIVEQNSIDEAWIDLKGCGQLFGSPRETAEKIMKEIMDKLDLWCSIGISENKFLAKMASELKKPLGITEVWAEDVPGKLWPLPVREMYGIGRQTEKKLNDLAIYSIGDIARFDVGLLKSFFGKYGEELHRLANGIDESPVTVHPHHDSKSISRSTTLPKDISDIETAKSVILQLVEEVGAEARRYGSRGKTVSIVIKYGDFQSISRQKSIPPTYLTRDIYQAGVLLLEQNWNRYRGVRLLGVGLSSFESDEAKQLSILDTDIFSERCEKEEKLERIVDDIRERFGSDKVTRARSYQSGEQAGAWQSLWKSSSI